MAKREATEEDFAGWEDESLRWAEFTLAIAAASWPAWDEVDVEAVED